MSTSPDRAQALALFEPIADAYLRLRGVDIGPMFGSDGLRIRGKIFAFAGWGGVLIAKLPEARVGELEASGRAERMTMQDRAMREWVMVGTDAAELWPSVVAEAFAFVDEITP